MKEDFKHRLISGVFEKSRIEELEMQMQMTHQFAARNVLPMLANDLPAKHIFFGDRDTL